MGCSTRVVPKEGSPWGMQSLVCSLPAASAAGAWPPPVPKLGGTPAQHGNVGAGGGRCALWGRLVKRRGEGQCSQLAA